MKLIIYFDSFMNICIHVHQKSYRNLSNIQFIAFLSVQNMLWSPCNQTETGTAEWKDIRYYEIKCCEYTL